MFRRLFWLFLGVGVGLGSSWWVTRRVKQVAARYSPERLSNGLTGSVRNFGHDLRLAVQEGREAMLKREAELRGELPRSVG
jgi:hypothetical protein